MQQYPNSFKQVGVSVFAPLWVSFDYIWPNTLGEPLVGLRVLVPFGSGQRIAIVSEVKNREHDRKLKEVLDRLDVKPIFNEKYYGWLDRAASYYLCSLGEMYELAFAWAGQDKDRRYRCLEVTPLNKLDADLALAFQTKRTVSLSTVAKYCQKRALQWRLIQAMERGCVEEVVKPSESSYGNSNETLTLRPQQLKAVDAILHAQQKFSPILLFGSTGSGKTEVYLQAAEALVANGKQVLILVPEIGLTPMWLTRLSSRFEHVAIWHSGLSKREKNTVRHQIKQTQVLLGTRSALFLPLDNLGLIVIDEEHDTSFKQQDGVAYSARDMSLLLAQALNVPVILGSATPSLESWRQVQKNQMACFRLTERVFAHTKITPDIIDMRGSTEILSDMLLQRIKETHARGEQSMLYLNRRGYAPALQCTACGFVPSCPACSLRLTLHRKESLLRCHTCDYKQRVQKSCKSCGEQACLPLGSGTERLEDELLNAMPTLKISRFDRDIVRTPDDLFRVLSQFEAGEIDCLVGTQMLVKGHHFPRVTLVGIINADLGMNIPDFRASERWWQQMTQVFGRTGRGEQAGKVVVQTWSPDAPWFKRLDESKAEDVLNDELSLREMTHFPPFARWVRIVFSAVDQRKAFRAAEDFGQGLAKWDKVKVSGPMPCALERLSGRYRYELIVRDEDRISLPWKMLPLLQMKRVPSGVRRKVDVDPQDMM